MAAAAYLVDTSVFVLRSRHQAVKERFDRHLLEGRLAFCQMVLLECLNNAPDPKAYAKLSRLLLNQRWADVTGEAIDRAVEVHGELAKRSQHRSFALPDLIIAATAELAGLTVLHYDEDYERIAKITGQAVDWVAPKGTL